MSSKSLKSKRYLINDLIAFMEYCFLVGIEWFEHISFDSGSKSLGCLCCR